MNIYMRHGWDVGSTTDVRIDVDEIANSLYEDARKMEKKSVASFKSSKYCIFEVPDTVSRNHEKAYSPIAFSIGPFHHAKQHLKANDWIKKKYMTDFIHANQKDSRRPNELLQEFVKAIARVKDKARECYTGAIDMKDDEFIRVMVLDGCFILELFCKRVYGRLRRGRVRDDPIFDTNFLLEFLYHDLILVENQIPWFVLECLLHLQTAGTRNEATKSLLQLVMEFFGNIFSTTPSSIKKLVSNKRHILDVLRESLLIHLPHPVRKYKQYWQIVPSATNLEEAGIKLKVRTNSKCILDVKFENGVLEIPQLLVQDNVTETLFRNLILLEQNCLLYSSVFTSYAALLENLVQTSSDLKLLRKRGIIETSMNIEEATQCFRKLIHGTHLKGNLYLDVTMEVNKSCRRRWPRYLRVLKIEYFNTPWGVISIIAAVILLILTFLQTLFTVINR